MNDPHREVENKVRTTPQYSQGIHITMSGCVPYVMVVQKVVCMCQYSMTRLGQVGCVLIWRRKA